MLDTLGVNMDYTHDGAGHRKAIHFATLGLCGRRFNRRSVILLIRDPRDTAVSGFFQAGKRLPREYSGTMADFIRDPHHGIEKIVHFNLTWLEQGGRKRRFLVLTYEGLSRNPVRCMQEVLQFVRIERPVDEVRQVVNDHTFEKMKEREGAGAYEKRYGPMLTAKSVHDAESYKVRRGKVGGYADYLSTDDIAYCESILSRYRYDERVLQVLNTFGIGESVR